MEKIRLNEQKRRLLKKEWSHTVYNNMPMQVEEDLKLAQDNFRSCLLYTSPSPRDNRVSRMPSSA